MTLSIIGTDDAAPLGQPLLFSTGHREALLRDADRQLRFFAGSLRPQGGFFALGRDGAPLPDTEQELHTATRLVHAYSLGMAIGFKGAEEMVDHGMDFILTAHRDSVDGGYFWSVDDDGPVRAEKLAYGHAFVLLASASAMQAGHPDAAGLMADVLSIIEKHFWEPGLERTRDELNRDFSPFSTYRGMNANMHLSEALMAAFEATEDRRFLHMAGSILGFFTLSMAPANNWRIPEHYHADWTPDPDYSGDPMFRPPGTTPGHSLEFARLLLQYWDLSGREDERLPAAARSLVDRALSDSWNEKLGGLAYTMDVQGQVAIGKRLWWPVTEGIGALASLIKLVPTEADEQWYRRLWSFSEETLIDHAYGGWYPELDDEGKPTDGTFKGKPDLYHSLQATLYPLVDGISRQREGLLQLAV
ncbi:AGE family epimerase/isomerase [Aureimonas altamirensis]|uniref:AGE family epimerase/isomerase n=1 Tax=Aureimonas altamirensis TaxID=370622 RepID=UPI001E4BB062|nr:AGE family epimerase/isomerase [Aureimonas altamirensis]UHD47156.1 AGE family epimerase/isomerase [Aureimonas altamirensis]